MLFIKNIIINEQLARFHRLSVLATIMAFSENNETYMSHLSNPCIHGIRDYKITFTLTVQNVNRI